jgi:hypothetical protein
MWFFQDYFQELFRVIRFKSSAQKLFFQAQKGASFGRSFWAGKTSFSASGLSRFYHG